MSTASPLASAQRIIVKTGSALIADKTGRPRTDWLESLAADIAKWHAGNRQVILVTSGAIALGKPALGLDRLHRLDQKQAAAAIGQPRLMAALQTAFGAHDMTVAQALLTLDDTKNRRRWLNARATLETLLDAGMIPVINENDTVATEEIRYGDNDRLAARVAQMLGADILILLSDVDGLYTTDPSTSQDAEHIPEIRELTSEIEAMAGGANLVAGVGSGGMVTKLAAARIAQDAGCSTAITLGHRPAPLSALESGEKASWILALNSPSSARKAWIKGHIQVEGYVKIDAGAARAVRDGASLLPVGVVAIEGQFQRGAILSIIDTEGQPVAKGICGYASSDIERIAGHQSEEIDDLLGRRARGPVIVHRNDLVLES